MAPDVPSVGLHLLCEHPGYVVNVSICVAALERGTQEAGFFYTRGHTEVQKCQGCEQGERKSRVLCLLERRHSS